VNEDHSKTPVDPYGLLKLGAEGVVASACEERGMNYLIVRPSAVYGPTDNNLRVIQQFLSRALDGSPIEIKGANERLDFTYVEDLAKGLAQAVLAPAVPHRVFNMTRGKARTLLEAAEIIAKGVTGTELITLPKDSQQPSRGALDISRARSCFGYEPHVDLEEGIALYLRSMKGDGP
jgi:nucleoside-diphosphate-sugar epimerase